MFLFPKLLLGVVSQTVPCPCALPPFGGVMTGWEHHISWEKNPMVAHKWGGCCQDPRRNPELFDEFPPQQQYLEIAGASVANPSGYSF